MFPVLLALALVFDFLRPFRFGVAVATAVGDGLLRDEVISPVVIVAGLSSAVIWNLVTWYLGLPSSSSHALVGGLLGAAVLSGGMDVVRIDGLTKILLALLLSPVVGILAGFLVMRLVLFLSQSAHPRVTYLFRRLQAVTLTGPAPH